ncbi:DMT family transporter [Ancylomarina euxinus]|uniref:DMT family transporter n=1 Tax=Ancylomarina euxinus TaxID=2283627 RepID=A0A425Y316_9BACT|nr:DMT family transporter [Ancylomarina euxinus]MCZ4693208.1 DMT family transporter [Ancylomarina euxinus]MUP15344.1 EamA family transporter [Ancylomarina euxinus]RRG22530.1 DMT family transporter [Ancylomarina euxinus]
MNQKSLLVYGSLILAMLFWSFSFIWTKIVFLVYNPVTTVFLRLIISSVILFALGKGLKKLGTIDKKDRLSILALAFFEPFLYFLGESFGLKYVSSTIGAVIISTIPLFSPIAAYYFHKEKLGKMNILGIVISIIGVTIIIFNKSLSLVVSPIGLICLFIAVGAAVGYSVVLKKLATKYNPITLVTYQNSLGLLYFLPLFLILDWQHFIKAVPTQEVLTALLLLAVFGSTLAFICFTYGLNHLGITKSNIFINVIPVFTAIFAYFVIDEILSFQKIVGMMIVIGGLFLSQIEFKRKTV